MKFSLILCTVDRTKEVEEFLYSISKQTYKKYEIIIVDQNNDNRIIDILKNFSHLDIQHILSEKGLSRSRNKGLLYANGDIVAFPDDDCTYPKELLANINDFFRTNKYDLLTGKTIDKKDKKIVAGKNVLEAQELKPIHILGSSTTLFIQKENFDIKFDERFGLGAIFNAEEENELIFRLLKQGCKGYYNPQINYVYHPPSDLDYKNIKRVQQRTIGLGAFIAKYILTKEGMVYFVKYNIVRPLSATILFAIKCDFAKSKYYFYRWLGIWKGFLMYFKVKNDTTI